MRRKQSIGHQLSAGSLPFGSLLVVSRPPGFDKHGRHLLAKCPEFKLYELYKPGGEQEIETAPEIEHALWRALFRINDSWETETRDERIAWVVAVKKLHNFTVRRYKQGDYTGAVPVACELAATLGMRIEAALASKDDPKITARRCGDMFRDTVSALLREANRSPDGRTDKLIPAVVVLIWEAQGMFQYMRKRPRKSELRKRLTAIGYGFSGPTATARWRELFRRAGLNKLPK